uniref:Uncharacterized protein n=1 Tax=Glossina pallidipes TaxID=7398 RepID=A0A1A9ZGS4_GLOPL
MFQLSTPPPEFDLVTRVTIHRASSNAIPYVSVGSLLALVKVIIAAEAETSSPVFLAYLCPTQKEYLIQYLSRRQLKLKFVERNKAKRDHTQYVINKAMQHYFPFLKCSDSKDW